MDLSPLKGMIGSAKVVALGESSHGVHEFLEFRNRLFQYLVEEMGFTAIAFETALPESRSIYDYVAEGRGTAEDVIRENRSWSPELVEENLALVRWMRERNAGASSRRKVHFYGIDLSYTGPWGAVPTPVPAQKALAYLLKVDPTAAAALRGELEPLLTRLTEGRPWPVFSQAESDALSRGIDDLISILERERLAYISATGQRDYDWAHRCAIVARQGDRAFRLAPRVSPGPKIPASAWQMVSSRDAALAENVQWVLEQEGTEGRILVFAHNAHVKNAPTEGGIWNYDQPPNAMGQYLKSVLGKDLVIFGTSSAKNAPGFPQGTLDPDGLDAALAGLGSSRFLLDLRMAATDAAASQWLAQKRAWRAHFTGSLNVSVGGACDVIFFTETLSPAHRVLPAK